VLTHGLGLWGNATVQAPWRLVQEVLLAGRLVHDAERWRWPPYLFFCLFFVAALTDEILKQVPALPCDMYRCPCFGEGSLVSHRRFLYGTFNFNRLCILVVY